VPGCQLVSVVPGLESFIMGLASNIIAKLLVFPKRIDIPILPGDVRDLMPRPRGLVRPRPLL
jgi:hypothetical protein